MRLLRLTAAAFVVLLVTFPAGAFAQTEQQTEDPIRFDLDFAAFRVTDEIVQVEVYLMVSRAEFEFVEADGEYKANYFNEVRIVKNDTLIDKDIWERIDRVEDPSLVKRSQKIPDITTFQVKSGSYRLVAAMRDKNSGRYGLKEFDVTFKPFGSDELVISDLELATNIVENGKKGLFSKYGRDIIPNAAATYGQEIPVLWVYYEIYNLSTEGAAADSEYSVGYSVTDLNGNVLLNLPTRRKAKPGGSSVEMGGINIITLQSKGYIFRTSITDHGTGETVTRSKKFFIYKPGEELGPLTAGGIGRTEYELMESQYSVMSKKELDDEWKMLKMLATRDEKKLYDSSDLVGKVNTMLQFWRSRENTISRDEFMERIAIANQQWSGLRTGWKTDRGRVIIQYGKPDEIEREPHSLDTKAYEIWSYYDLEGGVIFIFVDKQGFTDYELVHSTARSELQDYNWQRWIRILSNRGGADIGR